MQENTMFRKLDLFPSSGERGETPTLLGTLERANLGIRTRDRLACSIVPLPTTNNISRVTEICFSYSHRNSLNVISLCHSLHILQ
jgi:hypothetical protein